MKPANNAPLYAMVYAHLAEIARTHGYAMAVHGSLARDFDLICVPWVNPPGEPQAVVDAITSEFALKVIDSPVMKLHGRLCYTLSFGGDVFLDLSFMTRAPSGWQPIELAPKRGCVIGAYAYGVDRWATHCMWWDDTAEEWTDVYSDRYLKPTHWAPLPSANEGDCMSDLTPEQRDAARYRWLRQKRIIEPVTLAGYPWPVHVVTEHGIPTIVPCVGDELDRMIDAAIERSALLRHRLGDSPIRHGES